MIIERVYTTETVILSGVGENILVVGGRLWRGGCGRIASHLGATVARHERSRWKVVERGRIQLVMVGSGAQTLLQLSYPLATAWLDREGFAGGGEVAVVIHHATIPWPRAGARRTLARGLVASARAAARAITIGVVTPLTATTNRTSSRYRQHAHPVHLQITDMRGKCNHQSSVSPTIINFQLILPTFLFFSLFFICRVQRT